MNMRQDSTTRVLPADRMCPRCATKMDEFGPEGLCATCLLRAGLLGIADDSDCPDETINFPRSFGGYELLEVIARGGMGIVYKARQSKLNRLVAVKMIVGGAVAGPANRARFRQEAEMAARLHHPHIVTIHEVGEQDGQPFFSMDFVEGQNLAQLVGVTPLPAKQAAAYLKRIAEAVQHAHSKGVLHRDLKPSNVVVDAATNEPQVTDFGLAKWLEGDASLTQTGQVLGSPSFMSPEQASGNHGATGPASDVYSLGAMLYHMLMARPPFVAESVPATLRAVVENEPVSPRLLNASVPRDLETICLKCLEKEAPNRYANAKELAEELGRFLSDEPIHARPVAPVEKFWRWRRRNRALATAGAVVVALLLLLLIGSPMAILRINRERNQATANAQAEAWHRREAETSRQKAEAAVIAERTQRSRAEQLAEENRQNLYAARIKLAEQCVREGDSARTLELLDSLRPLPGETDLRSFDWHYLSHLCRSERLGYSQTGRLRSLTFSPDGELLALAGEDQLIHLLDAHTGLERAQLKGHSRAISALVFLPDGKALVSAGADGSVRLWEGKNYSESSVLFQGTNELNAIAVSTDGMLLAIGEGPLATGGGNPSTRFAPETATNRIYIKNLHSGRLERVSTTHAGGIRALCFSPNSQRLALGAQGHVHLVDVSTGKFLPVVQTNLGGTVMGLAFTPDGGGLLTAVWAMHEDVSHISLLDPDSLELRRVVVDPAGSFVWPCLRMAKGCSGEWLTRRPGYGMCPLEKNLLRF